MQSIVHVSLAGLSSGMFIWLVASGLTLIFGVLGVLNFAHGSFYMLGAYVCFTLMKHLGPHFWLGLLLGPLVVAAVGWAVERFFLRHVYHLALPYQLLLTFAFVLIFDDLVTLLWGAASIRPPVAAGLAGSVLIAGRKFPVYSLFVIAVGPLVALGLWALLEKTWAGRIVRAAASEREMAAAIGVPVPALFSGVFAFGCWVGALGGALLLLRLRFVLLRALRRTLLLALRLRARLALVRRPLRRLARARRAGRPRRRARRGILLRSWFRPRGEAQGLRRGCLSGMRQLHHGPQRDVPQMHDLRRHHWLQLSMRDDAYPRTPGLPTVGCLKANHRRQLWLLRKRLLRRRLLRRRSSKQVRA